MSKFKQVSSDGHQMPLAMEVGAGGGPMSGGGGGPGPGVPHVWRGRSGECWDCTVSSNAHMGDDYVGTPPKKKPK